MQKCRQIFRRIITVPLRKKVGFLEEKQKHEALLLERHALLSLLMEGIKATTKAGREEIQDK